MGFDAGKLDEIERIMDALSTENGRAATTAQVLKKAQEAGITASTGTTHRYMSEIMSRRQSRQAHEASVLTHNSEAVLPVSFVAHLTGLHATVDEFGRNVADMLHTAIAIERQQFVKTLADQHAASRRELAEAHDTIVDLQQTIDDVIAEGERHKLDQQKAVDEAASLRAETDRISEQLAAMVDERHARELKLAKLESEEQHQRELCLDLRLAKTAMANEIAALKQERDDLKTAAEDIGPMREALARFDGYTEGRRRADQVLEETATQSVSLKKS